MSTLAWILTSTLIVSAISLIGILFLSLNQSLFRKLLLVLVSFASGTLLGGAFLHLIPEALLNGGENLFIVILSGILVFFLLEKFLWRHCHERDCPVHVFAYLNLLGDGIHNFIDGILIAASFLTSTPLGFATALAVVSHEIPQEIGDFGILVYGGFSKVKALSYNLLSALMAFVGALLTYSFSAYLPSSSYFLMFAAGSFIYVATTDLIPELHKEHGVAKSFLQFALLVVGILLMWLLRA
ncbi:ZIP family metal transporter [Candidatus Bathyarchaeota archaeon]|nr:ZIP family metal transporter [Candidatus Bathyarchaeota archaeon]